MSSVFILIVNFKIYSFLNIKILIIVDNAVLEIHEKLRVLNFAQLICLKFSINKMFVIGLVLILCFLTLSLDIIDSKIYESKEVHKPLEAICYPKILTPI